MNGSMAVRRPAGTVPLAAVVVAELLLTVACASAPAAAPVTEEPGDAARHANGVNLGYATAAPAPDRDGLLRILVYHDMEGLAGQDDWRTFDFRHPEQYRVGQQLLVADLNAVIDGLFAGGAGAVHVVDGHGSFNMDPDLPPGALDPRAEQVFRDAWFNAYTDLVEEGRYDAVVVVGMHAKTGSGGFASHTYGPGIELWLEGRSLTETEVIALSWGRVGVPVIFASGDDRLRDDLRTMPWIEYVTVKEATSASTAALRPVEEARADLRAGAKRAAEGLPRMRTMRLRGPVRAAVGAVPPASLRALQGVPGVEYADARVSFEARDFDELYNGWQALTGIAFSSWSGTLHDVVQERADGEDLQNAYYDRLIERWLDQESGHPPSTADPPAPGPRRKYHGFY